MNLDNSYYTVYLKDIESLKKQDNSIGVFFSDILSIEKIRTETGKDFIFLSVKIDKKNLISYDVRIENGSLIKEPINFNWKNLPVEFICWNPPEFTEGIVTMNSSYWYEERGFKYQGNITKILRKEKLEYLNTL